MSERKSIAKCFMSLAVPYSTSAFHTGTPITAQLVCVSERTTGEAILYCSVDGKVCNNTICNNSNNYAGEGVAGIGALD